MTTSVIFEWTLRLASIGVMLGSAEMLVKRTILRRPGLLSPDIVLTRSPILMDSRVKPILQVLFEYRMTIGILVVRLLASLSLMFMSTSISCTVLIALTGVILSLRSPYGLDGSDQMTNIVFSSCALGLLVGTEAARGIVLIFLATMVCQSYFVAGIEKLRSKTWRSGNAIHSVAVTKLYGVRKIGEKLKRAPIPCYGMAWFVILFECLFTFGLFAPGPYWWIALISAGLFHLFAAVFMGLNSFFWAFLSTYPAVIFCRSSIGW